MFISYGMEGHFKKNNYNYDILFGLLILFPMLDPMNLLYMC
jgi:hypothetical protein